MSKAIPAEARRCFKEVEQVFGYKVATEELQCIPMTSWSSFDTELSQAFDWRDTPQGHFFWRLVVEGINPYTLAPDIFKDQLPTVVESVVNESEPNLEKVKSDGGKSSYYWVELPLESVKIDNEKGVVGFMLEEYITHGLNNDFDQGTIAKSNHRIGKKAGNSVEYDVNKILHSAERLKKKRK